MDNVTLAIAENEIEQQAARCQELDEQRRLLLARIRKADSAKEAVKERIYEKVRTEYEAKLRAVENELQPLVSALDKGRASIEEQMREVALQREALQDRLDEIAFRHQIGEFDASALERHRRPLEEERMRLDERRQELSRMLSRLGGSSATTAPATEAPARPSQPPERPAESSVQPAEPTAPAAESLAHRTEAPSTPVDEAEEDDAFVDPSKWLGEFLPDESTQGVPAEGDSPERVSPDGVSAGSDSTGNVTPEGAATDCDSLADPIENLADPGNEATEPVVKPAPRTAAPHRADSAPTGLPILTIARGSGAGKKLPLLPVSMTLGREVDNNIEIKDKDVARYHARISFESGRYVIQDLAGSSGTFVNGEKVKKAALNTGDVIRVGSTELCLDVV